MDRLTPRNLALLAGAASVALLLAAFSFQLARYRPCDLCILQRWPHAAAGAVALVIWWFGWRRWLALLGMLAAAVATGLAFYHTGIEYGWWQGVTACSSGLADIGQMSAADLLSRIESAPVVRCDQVQWQFLTLSMAGWNALISLGLTGLWAVSARGR